jgi:hypothetical protein
MEPIEAATQALDTLPRVLGRLWLAETVVSLAMAALVSLPLTRLWGVAKGAGAAALLVASLWLTVGVAQAALAARSHKAEPQAEAPAAAAAAPVAPPRRHAARPRRPAPRYPLNCIRVLTDPAQSTC